MRNLCSFSNQGTRSFSDFAGDVETLRPHLKGAAKICNALPRRYSFTVGLTAAMLNGQTTILPSATAMEAVSGTLDEPFDTLILGGLPAHDQLARRMETLPQGSQKGDPQALFHALAACPAAIHVFTSGTTKKPQKHIKNWRILKGGAALTVEILKAHGLDPEFTGLLGTTPHQHMYGLEATVFASLGWGYPTLDQNIFYPADLEAAAKLAKDAGLTGLALITSPAHLCFLEPAILEEPIIRMIISATAPLSHRQAERLEARGDLPVMEIYGSTETGSLAIRRTIEGDLWQPLAGFQLAAGEASTIATAPHLPEPTPLGDMVELQPDGRFTLTGRLGDMVAMHGKRTTLAALNAILAEAPGLSDGIVLHKKQDPQDLLVILAVRDPASGMTETHTRNAIRHHFHRHLDPVFAPKKTVFTTHLPRAGTGKIPAQEIDKLWERVL